MERTLTVVLGFVAFWLIGWTNQMNTGSTVPRVGPAYPVAYQSFTANAASACIETSGHPVQVRWIPNIAANENDAEIDIYRCPIETTTPSLIAGCTLVYFRGEAGTAVSRLDGDESAGTDAITNLVAPVVCGTTAVHPGDQTSALEVSAAGR